jgi:zinc D-Ala-D-Ala dipeptidase
MTKKFFSLLILSFILAACDYKAEREVAVNSSPKPVIAAIKNDSLQVSATPVVSSLERKLIIEGLSDIQAIDSTIVVDLKYSGCDNFLFLDMYGDLDKCYLQPDVAVKLKNAQSILRKKFPYYSLIVFDGVRPRSIQFKMWDTIAVPAFERSKYVSNPRNGSLHNFGAAVDLSIIDENGIELDMGTAYDYFGELAYPREEKRLIREGKLSYKQLYNREVLRDAMLEAGFMAITTEWWHFNSCTRNEALLRYKIIE